MCLPVFKVEAYGDEQKGPGLQAQEVRAQGFQKAVERLRAASLRGAVLDLARNFDAVIQARQNLAHRGRIFRGQYFE